MKFSAKIFAAVLALSISVGTGVCAAAADESYTEENDSHRLIAPYVFVDSAKQTAAEMLQNISEKIHEETVQNIRTILQLLKDKSQKYSFRKGRLYLTEGDFTYLVHLSLRKGDSFAELISYSGSDTEITVPAFADKFPVARVFSFGEMDEAYRYSVTTLNLPATVKNISGADIFDLFGLQNVNIDAENPYITSVDGVVFDKEQKMLLALPPARISYTVPDTVTEIGDYACYASSLENITLSDSILRIGECAFFSSPKLKEIHLSVGTCYIGNNAFGYCVNLEKAVVPAAVDTIEEDAFENVSEKFVMISADTLKKGETFTITVPQKDGLQYAVYYKNSTDKKWTTKQSFTENNIVTVKPARTGMYQVCVKIMSEDGTVLKNYFDVTVQTS